MFACRVRGGIPRAVVVGYPSHRAPATSGARRSRMHGRRLSSGHLGSTPLLAPLHPVHRRELPVLSRQVRLRQRHVAVDHRERLGRNVGRRRRRLDDIELLPLRTKTLPGKRLRPVDLHVSHHLHSPGPQQLRAILSRFFRPEDSLRGVRLPTPARTLPKDAKPWRRPRSGWRESRCDGDSAGPVPRPGAAAATGNSRAGARGTDDGIRCRCATHVLTASQCWR